MIKLPTVHIVFLAALCLLASCEQDTASRRWRSHAPQSGKPVVEYVLREETTGAMSLESITMKGTNPRSRQMEERKFDILNQQVQARTIRFELGQTKGTAFTLSLPETLGTTFEAQLSRAGKTETVAFRQVKK